MTKGQNGTPGEEADERRVGLALSGGGFRASFFHIGVLARLAELDLLRQIEVISTVSGGSIVGALYYLHVKNLLETIADEQITRRHYIEIVQAIEEDFLWATQRNMRARIFFNIRQNVHMALPAYSRTNRLGEQLEEFIYKPAWSGELARGRIRMRDLQILPVRDRAFRRPDKDNCRRRRARVPVLLINATTLNTGRSWRFEAVRMGEALPSDPNQKRVAMDLNRAFYLVPGYFEERDNIAVLDGGRLDVPLGLAVAASAAVPMLFHPISIKRMYAVSGNGRRARKLSVELVDGGVHDNQGVQGLFDRKCSHLIVSDASRQFDPRENPFPEIPSVFRRTVDSYGARLRQEQLVRAEGDAPGLSVALVHLRRGLEQIGLEPGTMEIPQADPLTDFGISTAVQSSLATMRTDLDNFGDVEAAALMLDGYKMIEDELGADSRFALEGAEPLEPGPERWHFGQLDRLVGVSEPQARLERRLTVGTKRFVKPLRFFPRFWQYTFLVLLLVAGGALAVSVEAVIFSWHSFWGAVSSPQVPVWIVVVTVAGVAFIGGSYALQVRWKPLRLITSAIVSRTLPVLLAPFLWVMAFVQLCFNRFYLRLASYRSVGGTTEAAYSDAQGRSAATSFSRRARPKAVF